MTLVYRCVCSGLWNVPYITQAYLIKGSVLRSKLSQVSLYVDEGMDPDMVFCRSIRDQVMEHLLPSQHLLMTSVT